MAPSVVYGNITRLRLFWGRDLIVRKYLPVAVELRSRGRVGLTTFDFSFNQAMLPRYGRTYCQTYCLQTTSSPLAFILFVFGILFVRSR